ncbi:Tetratricopeptide repeat protein [Anatilimnocola aggregata]|uniref:Tetratricopeptide repeat protein n=1 Tax=Anatilimnocola aggregata TaxID=2528021 RepID=A0A517Y7B3_9BACT|nr:tetratricopeptide repeat protein [Anatilimnocola aggregata]QDU26133.1 Tetratricopeptide repeat protein [Anatilimnocola aggregata]
MTKIPTRAPRLDQLYHRYLDTEESAGFVQGVSEHYLLSTLERLANYGQHVSRRAAVLAISFLGDYSHNATLGRALHDHDRAVRLLADNGIRTLWLRDGSEQQQQSLQVICRLNDSQHHAEAIEAAGQLIDEAAWFAEAWNQRAIGYFATQRWEDAANDCHQTLEINPYHFGAAVGMGHCYLEMDDPFAALECFRRAVKLNPDLEDVRAQVDYLQRTLEGK